MTRSENDFERYQFIDYIFEKTTVRYVVIKQSKSIFLLLIPNSLVEFASSSFETNKLYENGFPNVEDWYPGALVHIHLSHHYTPMYDNSLKFSESTKSLYFKEQKINETSNSINIETILSSDEGYEVSHILRAYHDENGFEVFSKFTNKSDKEVILEMITSASLDNLSPFFKGTKYENLTYHYFKGGWSTEGKHIEMPLTQLNMEKSWGGSFENEKIGSIGSKTVGRFYPYAALEDKNTGCIWGVKLKHNATWQIELSRCGTPLSLSVGIGDFKFGHWRKKIKSGASFKTPTAYIAATIGGIAELSNDLIRMNDRDIDNYGEEGMPIIFNDWVTNWGDTSFDKAVSLSDGLKNSKVKYFVIDDGWQTGGVGDWTVDKNKFPHGIKEYSKMIREKGMIPGIWMEFENVRDKAIRWDSKFDNLYLKKDGYVINNAASNIAQTKFLDFRKKEVINYLHKTVIDFLKENQIGYLKVDYNSNIGLGCDGGDSLGDALICQMNSVYEFFKMIKKEIPDIVLENCSTGGSRLEPKMMSITAMSSISDAHECIEVPIIAANMHYLISPRQAQVWCVLKREFNENRMKYAIASGFLGRLCWSGDVDKLSGEQKNIMLGAEAMYEAVSHIIKKGRSTIFRTKPVNNRNPKGTQAVVRYSEDKKEILIVTHYFNDAEKINIPLDGSYCIKETLFGGGKIVNNKLVLSGADISADVILLKLD